MCKRWLGCKCEGNCGRARVGGHCMLAVGYTSASNTSIQIIVRNSWSEYVGFDGYHFMPLEYFLDKSLCMDFWTIRTEEITSEDPTTVPPDPEPVAPPAPIIPPSPIIPEPIPQPEHISIWKKPSTYALIILGLASLLFVLL